MNTNQANGTDRLAGSVPMKSSVSTSTEDREYSNDSALALGFTVKNLTKEQLIIRDRYGMTYVIDPTNMEDRKPTARELIIYHHFCVDHRCTIDVTGLRLRNNFEETDEKIAKLREEDFEDWTTPELIRSRAKNTQRKKLYKTVISVDDLTNDGAYIESIDMVVYLASSRHTYHHPESVIGRMLRKNSNKTVNLGFTFNIEIFDSKNSITDRWIRQGKMAMRVGINREGIEQDGARIRCTAADGRISEDFIPLDELSEQLGIYKSKEDALQHDINEEMKETNLRLEKEIEDLKRQTQREGFENKRKEQFYERDKTERTHTYSREKADTEHEQFKQKAEYESQSLNRKNIIEILKFVPSVITAVTGLILVFGKLNKKS